ncbi:MAG TPA: DUF4440 domain-containing protein [Gemmatimonadales bacterium]|jgi:ketosteroid isomerase-like protein|nr:DUF4440 domain-containing protein [Gemmatimonadales bacterium]
MTRRALPWLALICLLPACGGGARAGQTDSTAAAPPVNLAAEEATIRRIDSLWVDAISRRDTAVITATYEQDALFLPPNAPRVAGRDAIRQAWAGLLATPGFRLTFTPDRIVLSPDGQMAYDVGVYQMQSRTGQVTRTDQGKYLVVWRKLAGQWKVAADMVSSDK